MNREWPSVTRRRPCGICKATRRCAYSADGRVSKCTNVPDAPGAAKHGNDEVGDYTIYFAAGTADTVRRAYTTPAPAAPLATTDTRDRVYATLLAVAPLSAEHRTALLRRGLSESDLVTAGYGTLPPGKRERAQIVASVKESLCPDGTDLPSDVPGLHRGQLPDHVAGTLIPVRTATGEIVALKVRCDRGETRYLWLSSSSQGGASPGSIAHVPADVPALLDDASRAGAPRVVRLTEGELKADVATALSGLPTVSIPSATAARAALDALKALRVDVVRLAWDADARSNVHVAGGIELAAHLLSDELPQVQIELDTWPTSDTPQGPQPKGVDDALASGAQLTVHTGQAMWRELVGILYAAGRVARPETLARAGMDGEDESPVGLASASPSVPANDATDAPTTVVNWRSTLLTSADGRIVKGFANTCALLRDSPEWASRLAWNKKQQVVLLDGRPIIDNDVSDARVAIERMWRFDPGTENTWAAMRYAANARIVDPVADYLTGLKWDGVKRLDTAAARILGARGPLAARMFRMFMISAVARALDPGCKVDTLMVLLGDQGLKKSSLLRGLAGPEWFTDSHVDLTSKDAFIQFAHAWIIEWAEIERIMQRHDSAFTKSLIPSREDKYRAPYGRGITTAPRSCIFVGTTNQRQFLSDETGDRRYWCIEVTRTIELDAVAAERDHLWAEAVAAYLAGEKWWFDASEDRERALAASIHAVDDAWMDPVSAWIDAQVRTDFTTRELLSDAVQLPMKDHGRDPSSRIARIMRRLGYRLAPWRPVRAGVKLKVTKCWVPERVEASQRLALESAAEDGRVPGRGDAYEGPTGDDESEVDAAAAGVFDDAEIANDIDHPEGFGRAS